MEKNIGRLFSLLLVAAFLPAGFSLAAAEADKLAADKCERCHGNNGNSEKDDVPSIAGFSEVVIIDAMEMYRSGERTGAKYRSGDEPETDMNEIARQLDDADTEALAVFYSQQEFLPRTQKFDAKLAEQGAEIHDSKCENCHSKQGSNPDDDAAILAGQWTPYLKAQFIAFSSGEREAPKKMKKKLEKLSDGEVEALLNFYASQQ